MRHDRSGLGWSMRSIDPVESRPQALVRALAAPLRSAIAGQVVALFNDTARGERPVARSNDARFSPASVAWRVHGDVGSMMIGGVASLMLQMLMPEVLAGVWDHSNFRTDMHGRLRRTARFIATTTYADRGVAEQAIARVRRIHDAVTGTLPDGTAYRANDPASLAWVHVTEITSFLAAWRRYAEPGMSSVDADRYIAEMAPIGTALGAAPVPLTLREANAFIGSMRPRLSTSERSRDVLRMILARPAANAAIGSLGKLTGAAAIDLLPRWARSMHGLSSPHLARPLVRSGAHAIAGTLRWAFERP